VLFFLTLYLSFSFKKNDLIIKKKFSSG